MITDSPENRLSIRARCLHFAAMSTEIDQTSYDHFGSLSAGAASLAAPAYRDVVDLLSGFAPSQLKTRKKRLDRAVDELGLHFSDDSWRAGFNPWQLDLFPLSIDAESWARISSGVVQRALAFNAYATDLYKEQRVLKERVIPQNVALQDPAFLRPLSGIEVPNGEYSQFGAFDLVDAGEGDWRILEHHMGTPFGLSHVLQNRRILSEVFPELFERIDVAPVAGFSTYLLEMLRAQSSKMNPHVLLLTSGHPGQAYFEEAFIARHMGVSIAQPGDLLVRESRVFLKTIRGLEPVDVIYRRIESSALDPIAVPASGGLGVPGLINVWRKGNVSIVNAPGVGVTDNRALLRYDKNLINFYLGQSPILPSVETFHLGDVDQRAYVNDHREQLLLKPIQDHDIIWNRCGGQRPGKGGASLSRIAEKFPEYFVAQSVPEAVHLPRFKDGQFDVQGIHLRVYYILGKEPIVMPGGLARHSSTVHRTRRLTLTTSGFKDVLVPDSVVMDAPPKRQPAQVGKRYSIGSRVAESLYWAGRYIERAENTARQFNTLERLRWDQMASSEQRTYWPLLQAVAAATGQTKFATRKRPPSDTLALSRSLLLDATEGASVRACLALARNSLELVRETISPECREVLEEVTLFLNKHAGGRITRASLRTVSEAVVSEVARFNGTAERTMPHDDAWQFYRIGIFFERAMGVLLLLKTALPKIVKNYADTDEENADLTALLRLLGSLDAYRRTYRSRAYVDRVAHLLLLGDSNPSAVSFSLRNLHYAIGTLSIHSDRTSGQRLQRQLLQQVDDMENLSFVHLHAGAFDPLFTKEDTSGISLPHPDKVAEELEALTRSVERLHERIEDIFFSHQHGFAQDPVLFDIG